MAWHSVYFASRSSLPTSPEYLRTLKNIMFDYRTIDSFQGHGSAIDSERQKSRFDLSIETANDF